MDGSMQIMPLLIINMGGEMMYVLDQRLKAQSISPEKASKVMEDIIKTMYNEKFMQELFKPHRMYTDLATRQIFDRLVHSSIMRLNQSSMDKLYELMKMGYKFQLLSCGSADELLHITTNHLIGTKALVKSHEAKLLLDGTILLTSQMYGTMAPASFYFMKQYLCRFFQDTKVRVSLFLQNGIQAMDGTLSLRYDGYTATGGKVPGVVHYHNNDINESENELFQISSSENVTEAPRVPILEREYNSPKLGLNMYQPGMSYFTTSTKQAVADAKKAGAKLIAPTVENKPLLKRFNTTATDGINLLADLLGSNSKSMKDYDIDRKSWRLNLFPNNDSELGAKSNDFCDTNDDTRKDTIWIDASSECKHATATLIGQLNLDEDKPRSAKTEFTEDDEDLLTLMDKINT